MWCEYELVYMSPESMLTVLHWREMFRTDTYQHNLMCLAIVKAHCVESWYVYCANILYIKSVYIHVLVYMLFVHAGERNLEKSFPTLVKFGLFYLGVLVSWNLQLQQLSIYELLSLMYWRWWIAMKLYVLQTT